jgi:SAM-dependent methyltransferase
MPEVPSDKLAGRVLDSREDYYDGDYHHCLHSHLIHNDRYFSLRATANQQRFLAEFDLRRSTVFDYGCGIGHNIFGLPHGSGYDVSSVARKCCQQRGIPVYENMGDVPKGTWDIVLCSHMLEHLERPLDHLLLIKTLLKKTGTLVLILPREPHSKANVHKQKDIHQHLYSWNLRSISNLLTRAGYVVIRSDTKYVLGYRVLLFLERWFGYRIYYRALAALGFVWRCGHLVLHAVPAEGDGPS